MATTGRLVLAGHGGPVAVVAAAALLVTPQDLMVDGCAAKSGLFRESEMMYMDSSRSGKDAQQYSVAVILA